MGRFTGQVAVVTGGTTGIGLATAQLLAVEGAHVVIAGRDVERGDAAVAAITGLGGDARFVRCDVADDAQVQWLAAGAAAPHGRIDIWFNNAGTEGVLGTLDEVDDEVTRLLLEVNQKGVVSGMRHAVRHMARGGVIVNNASFVGTAAPIPIAIAYGGTKAAVVSMTRAAAEALADQGIRVLAVCPYIVDTPMVDRITGGQGADARAGFAAAFAPSGKLTQPEEVAALVADLCDERLPAASGDAYLIDAGAIAELEGPSMGTSVEKVGLP
jgi:NAD(P)-dependent dehydrogenase (short-subunit alcohol dehydrogenase family)